MLSLLPRLSESLWTIMVSQRPGKHMLLDPQTKATKKMYMFVLSSIKSQESFKLIKLQSEIRVLELKKLRALAPPVYTVRKWPHLQFGC